MTSRRKLKSLQQSVLADGNVNLAVAFESAGADSGAIGLLVDCEQSDSATLKRLTSDLCRRLDEPMRLYRLADARPAAMLMRQVLDEGRVLKDENGVWAQLQSEREEIVREAETHERFAEDLRNAVKDVVESDDNVTLAVEFAPIGPKDKEDEPSDLNLLLGCVDEADDVVMATFTRLQETGFTINVMPMAQARDFPYALSHIVRTGQPLKDTEGEWERLQAERDKIIEAGARQHQTTQLAKKLYGGPGGSASLN